VSAAGAQVCGGATRGSGQLELARTRSHTQFPASSTNSFKRDTEKDGHLLVRADAQEFVVFGSPEMSFEVGWRDPACSPQLLHALERAIELASEFAVRDGAQSGLFFIRPATDFQRLEWRLSQRRPPSPHTFNRTPKLRCHGCVGSSPEQFVFIGPPESAYSDCQRNSQLLTPLNYPEQWMSSTRRDFFVPHGSEEGVFLGRPTPAR
jgi:hypothetical protein